MQLAHKKNRLVVWLAALVLLIIYYTIFGRFFPNESGSLGHDYAFFLPSLLDGFFWYHINGLGAIPWFSPSLCGGTLNYIRTYSGFYTLPQFFTFFFDPLSAVRLTFVLFAGMGLGGFYLLLRRAFSASQPVSLLGAGLFLFNGFFAHRMLIGHLGLHSVMLIPLIAFFLLRPLPSEGPGGLRQLIFDNVIGGLLLAYMVHSGFGTLMVPAIITIVLLGLIHGLRHGRQWDFWQRWAGAGVVGVLLSSSKITATVYFMKNFPRSLYKLPGTKSILDATWLLFKSLFISPANDPERAAMFTNLQWSLDRHELEYSVTIVPLLIILYGTWRIGRQIQIKELLLKLNRSQWIQAGAILALCILPVAINIYSPEWNAFLKQLPLIKTSSSLIRWFIIYIPVVILTAMLVIEKTTASAKKQWGFMLVGMVAVIALSSVTDRSFYHRQSYDPAEIVKNYHTVKAGLLVPEIKSIGVYMDKSGRPILPLFRNNLIVYGSSQLYCYDPIFGYRLEAFPVKNLHPGAVLEEKEGVLNIKNPSCYVWPEANNCEPGDHFRVGQKEAAAAFANYRPFPFLIPTAQKVANWLNVLSLIAVMFFLAGYATRTMFTSLKKALFSGGFLFF